MAVVETGAIFNSLVFGGIDSADYGIYITGEAVYNAPTRAVEMVSVPGRNGAIAIDQGYYENIEVSYPCGTFAQTQAEFATNLASFRNAILSQKGYNRLTDTYNPNEYRMATYIAGLEVSPTNIGIAGEFSLKFNAKPQRWLTSGESAQTIAASGRTITNPTLYDASPLVEVKGYGTINVNGYAIEITNETLGDVSLWEDTYYAVGSGESVSVSINPALFAQGDTITISPSAERSVRLYLSQGQTAFASVTATNTLSGATNYVNVLNGGRIAIHEILGTLTFTKGTSATRSDTLTVQAYGANNTIVATARVILSVAYNGTDKFTYTLTYQVVSGDAVFPSGDKAKLMTGQGSGVSTVSMLGNPTYIDCDLGVCYKIESGTVIDLNGYIDLGSDLPVLSSGSNTITYDNTVTSLKITPRWWQL